MLESCLDCIVGIAPSAGVIKEAQDVLDAFSGTCQGINLPSLTLSIPPGATGSSAAPGATSSVTFSSLSTPLSAPLSTNTQPLSTSGLPTLTPTIPAPTSLSRISQVTVTAMSTLANSPVSTSSSADSLPPNGASNLIAWNGIMGVGVAVVAGMLLVLV
ncbi:hypothetical protein C0995_008277 [Termitomyces sp. Mi166|nr:hypothetical protein C0995_008277 [Termitomyces sp. Mi166\